MSNRLITRTGSLPVLSRKGYVREQIILPLPPSTADTGSGQDVRFEMEIYARFMRHLRQVPNNRMEIKILSSIQFTADMLDISEPLVAKTLVDMGLRAPRKAFSMEFLDFCDRCLLRNSQNAGSDIGSIPPAVVMLKQHWDGIGEDRFGPLPIHLSALNEAVYVS